MIFIGIDIGLDGAIAIINGDGIEITDTPTMQVEVNKKKRREYQISAMAKLLQPDKPGDAFAVLEFVHAFPGQGSVSNFTFGRGSGLWEGILGAFGIPFSKVSPQRWKKAMLADTAKDKDASRMIAMRLFPGLASQFARKKDDGRAEALLMAEYGRRTYNLQGSNEVCQ